MIVSIHQPGYLPWHGLFHRLALSDVHVFFDTAQFEKNGFNNRVKIRANQGEAWLTVPVRTKGRFGDNAIRDAEIDSTIRWRDKHWKTLQQCYGRAPFFTAYAKFFADYYATDWRVLGDMNMGAITYVAAALGLTCRFVKASELDADGTKSDLVLSLCRAVGATVYVSGTRGRDYLDRPSFERAGIDLRFQAYREPAYTQFEPPLAYMSVVDLLFCAGPSAADVMTAGQDSLGTGTVKE